MADKSKNEQYDIVAQAEMVLAEYIKRYFNSENIKGRAKNQKKKKLMRLLLTAGACAAIVSAYIFSQLFV